MPKFSVVIPSYNRSTFLKSAIESVLKQDFSDFELLVIDDGSTDQTQTMVNELSERDKRIKYIFQSNGERGKARNNGFDHAKGEYVVFLDSDDEFLPGHLSHLNELSEQHPEVLLLATNYEFFENGKSIKAPIDNIEEGFHDYSVLLRGNPFASNVCVKKSNPSYIPFPEDRTYSAMEDWMFLFSNLWTKNLFLSKKSTVRMNEHPNRSMRFHTDIIQKRELATAFLIQHFSFSKREKKQLKGNTFYFLAIHSYLDHKKAQAIRYFFKSFLLLGPSKKLLILFPKIIVGQKMISQLKNKFRS
ncbi:MAG: glycosyltransferase family 2 protein [Flavobacteriales bacterium]|nr:glycosyltransferase family 2 protein [Flavobacteriales bacterium]